VESNTTTFHTLHLLLVIAAEAWEMVMEVSKLMTKFAQQYHGLSHTVFPAEFEERHKETLG